MPFLYTSRIKKQTGPEWVRGHLLQKRRLENALALRILMEKWTFAALSLKLKIQIF
jgi:hypothetical protein